MADAADVAGDRTAVELAARVGAIRAAIPAGVAGECDECGELMPRLVGGRCGFCRDGRRPPLAIYDRLPVPTSPAKEQTMPNPPPSDTFQVVSIRARGAVLAKLRERAESRGVTLAQAAAELIETDCGSASAASAPRVDVLTEAPIELLMAELGRRVGEATPAQLAEANARAEAAERRLAAIKSAMETGA